MKDNLKKNQSSRRKPFFSQVIDKAIDQGFPSSIPVSEKAKNRLIDDYCEKGLFNGTVGIVSGISDK